jgi:peptidoglycan-associated lipoprotein
MRVFGTLIPVTFIPMTLFMLTGCLHSGESNYGKPLFPSTQAPSKGQYQGDDQLKPMDQMPVVSEEDAKFQEFSIEDDGSIKFATEIVYFEFDRYSLNPKARIQLQALAAYLKKAEHITLKINGHADERGTTEYNLALGLLRGRAVQKYMQDLGIGEHRLDIISFGEEVPLNPEHSESAWAQNRRVDFKMAAH